jgi:hypothetical protein
MVGIDRSDVRSVESTKIPGARWSSSCTCSIVTLSADEPLHAVNERGLMILRLQADDPELEAIRQRRMAQLMAQQGGGKVTKVALI